MPELTWHQAVEKAEPFIFRIFTPQGSGSGFLISKSERTDIVAVATALHVLDHAQTWNEPIRLEHYSTGNVYFLNPADRAIHIDTEQDTAAIIFVIDNISFDKPVPDLIVKDKILKTGVEVGWLGFPAVSSGELCFFSGRVSAAIQNQTAYLVDGVAINGVSGGPTISIAHNEIQYIGVVSAYIPNRSTGESLPGLAVIQDVNQFHDVTSRIKSIDEAKKQETEKTVEPVIEPPE